MNFIGRQFLWLAAFCLLGLSGCGLFAGSGQVEGVVFLNGEPTGGFEVTLTPAKRPDSGVAYYGTAGEQGKFRISQGKGNFLIPAGTYRVTFATIAVSDSVPVLNLNLPAQYSDPAQASIQIDVKQGKNNFDLKLEAEAAPSKGRRPISE